jgi:hypothetical protein
MGTTDPSASASPSGGAQATDGSHKGVAQVALAGGKGHHSVLVGRRLPRGHKHNKAGAAHHSTNNPISYPGY